VSIGKVSHQPGGTLPPPFTVHQVPFSWDVATGPPGSWRNPSRAFFAYAGGKAYNRVSADTKNEPPRLPYELADVDDDGYPDGLTAGLAIEQLRALAKREQPFLLAVGFFKPHLPFNAPKKYWGLYERGTIPAAPWPKLPRNLATRLPLHDSYEPTRHYDWPDDKGHISEQQGRALKRGYWAAVSYVDAQIGKLLDEYRRLGLEKNTIVVLWADHGWHPGDDGIWGKNTNYEWALRSPLMIRVPGMPRPGEAAPGIAETIDVYPTLADLCGLEGAPDDLPGTSLAPLVANPSHPGKPGARSAVLRGTILSSTLRTDRYRVVEGSKHNTKNQMLVELYDHQSDPLETANIAEEKPEVVARLLAQLHGDTPQSCFGRPSCRK